MSPPKCLLLLGNSRPCNREGQYLEVRIYRTKAWEIVKAVKCLSLQTWGPEFHLSTHRNQVSSKLVKDDLNKTRQTKIHGQQLKMMIP